ncbi:MAG: hypothetical protein ACRDLR_07580, partial [Gaiellaceae bacterium]
EEPTRWLSTETAIDHEIAGDWEQARTSVEELIPGYAESPFWIEPQTRICRARMLLAHGDVVGAIGDAERAVELAIAGGGFQSLCDPLSFRARLHAELGELHAAESLLAKLIDAWTKTRSSYISPWVLEAWYAAWRTRDEDRLDAAISAMPPNPWLSVAAAMVKRDFAAAVSALDELGAASPAALTGLWAAEWYFEHGNQPEAGKYLEQSLSFWRSVGASRYLRRGEALLAAAS